MVATRWPAFISATAMCMAVVDLPEPPFSLPSTTTWADCVSARDRSTNMTRPRDQLDNLSPVAVKLARV